MGLIGLTWVLLVLSCTPHIPFLRAVTLHSRVLAVQISCGEENKYNHPSQEVLDRLVKFGSDIYMTNNGTYTREYHRTVVGGEIQITTDGIDTYDVSLLDKNQMTKTYKIKKVSSPECFP